MKSALISLAFFLAAAGSVAAQSNTSTNQSNTSTNVVNVGNGIPTATGATGGAPLGWNSFHALYCLNLIDASGNQWTYVFAKETPSKSFFTENISYWADAFRSACPNSSLVGIHVTNSINGTFDQVAVYGSGF